MPPKKSKDSKKKSEEEKELDEWKSHGVYTPGISSGRVVTRSQTVFNRIKNSDSDSELFSDPTRHQPPGQPHIMELMKGKFGAIPRTIITKETAQQLHESEDLCKKLDAYKKYKPSSSDKPSSDAEEEDEEKSKDKPS